MILGLPPIHIQNKINQIKHFLKINISNVPGDQLKDTIKEQMSSPNVTSVELSNALKHVFKYLQWKVKIHQNDFTEEDKKIINETNLSNFHRLTSGSCHYTKEQMTKYSELLWADSLKNEFQCEGYTNIPKPSCAPLQIEIGVSRKTEVMLMQMFYENNLLNSFLYRSDEQSRNR